jgi:hypothetical protein
MFYPSTGIKQKNCREASDFLLYQDHDGRLEEEAKRYGNNPVAMKSMQSRTDKKYVNIFAKPAEDLQGKAVLMTT